MHGVTSILLLNIIVHATSADTQVCSEGHFRCNSTVDCIHQIQNCDGQTDCPDGSDEWDCDDEFGSKYWDHLFRKNPSAEHDDLDDKSCRLPYNGSCVCRSRDLLCQHKGLQKAPSDLPLYGIDMLDFTGNPFQILKPSSLESLPSDVDTLVLKDCLISVIEKDAFCKLSGMRALHLDNNLLKVFPEDIFSKDNELIILVISRNQISNIAVSAFRELRKLNELDLGHNHITEVNREVLKPLISLNTLYLNGNRISHIKPEDFPPMYLETLSLAENRLETLERGTFKNLQHLQDLYLSGNRIKKLKNGVFFNLRKLLVLYLNANQISTIEYGVFEDTKNLTSLYLKNNKFRSLDKRVLKPLQKLKYIYFDRFEMCLAALHVRVCEPRGDGISSQEHLLDNPILRASVWIMGAVGCAGNLVVLFCRILAPNNNVVHSLYLRNLAVSDLLMGIYLFTIAAADHYYRGVYLQHENEWRHSTLCKICGFLSTLSCCSSVLVLSLVTWDRFVSVTQPLARNQPTPKAAAFTLFSLWMLAAVVALAPLSGIANAYFGDAFYGNNGVCLSLHIHDPYDQGWEYSAVMFILLNAAGLVFICFAYCRMIHEIRASGVACRSTRQNQDRDKVAQRFGIIILSDCLCWVPVILVKLLALSGIEISEDLYAWLAVLVLPVNSALNPVLYTITTTIFVKQVQKTFSTFLYKHRRADQQHSDSALSSTFQMGTGHRRITFNRGTQSTIVKTSWKKSPPTAV